MRTPETALAGINHARQEESKPDFTAKAAGRPSCVLPPGVGEQITAGVGRAADGTEIGAAPLTDMPFHGFLVTAEDMCGDEHHFIVVLPRADLGGAAQVAQQTLCPDWVVVGIRYLPIDVFIAIDNS